MCIIYTDVYLSFDIIKKSLKCSHNMHSVQNIKILICVLYLEIGMNMT